MRVGGRLGWTPEQEIKHCLESAVWDFKEHLATEVHPRLTPVRLSEVNSLNVSLPVKKWLRRYLTPSDKQFGFWYNPTQLTLGLIDAGRRVPLGLFSLNRFGFVPYFSDLPPNANQLILDYLCSSHKDLVPIWDSAEFIGRDYIARPSGVVEEYILGYHRRGLTNDLFYVTAPRAPRSTDRDHAPTRPFRHIKDE